VRRRTFRRRLAATLVVATAARSVAAINPGQPGADDHLADVRRDLYGADTTIAGSASLIANLPADEWRPEVWQLSQDETSVLISAPVRVSGQRFDRASTLALTPGAQPHVVVPQTQWLNQYSFIDAGHFVVYGNGSSIYRVSATGALNTVLVASKATSGYSLAPGGVQQVEFSGVGDATAFVSTWAFIPAQ